MYSCVIWQVSATNTSSTSAEQNSNHVSWRWNKKCLFFKLNRAYTYRAVLEEIFAKGSQFGHQEAAGNHGNTEVIVSCSNMEQDSGNFPDSDSSLCQLRARLLSEHVTRLLHANG